jgi:uncharacterized tellurite resistance protein B-like protein
MNQTLPTVDSPSGEQNSMHALEALLLQSDLLAGMARVDGKVLDIESVFASTYLEHLNTEKSALVKSHYDYVVQNDETDGRIDSVMEKMSYYPNEEKYRILRCLSALAICDGELHPNEAAMLKKFADAMNIDGTSI